MLQQITINNYIKCVTFCIICVACIIICYSRILDEKFKPPTPLRKAVHLNDSSSVDQDYSPEIYISRMIYGRPRIRRKRTETILKIVTAETNTSTKNILVWNPHSSPFSEINLAEEYRRSNCEYSNCLFTANKDYLRDVCSYDAILFSEMAETIKFNGPPKRSPRQKYVFVSRKHFQLNPENRTAFDNYFNWTWTYRLNSDILWRNYVIFNSLNNTVIGPSEDVKWLEYHDDLGVKESVLKTLRKKKIAAISILPECHSKSRRELYIQSLIRNLKAYNLSLALNEECSFYGADTMMINLKNISNEYYFYLAFEDSFEKDYVTEHILTALNRYMIPVVLGGADYSRFLPPGSYLNSLSKSPRELAKTMHNLISNPTLYQSYFRWTNYYYFKPGLLSEVCNFCKALNNETFVQKETVYKNFANWWDPIFG